MSFRSSTYRAVARKVIVLRNLRKVKLFPTVGSVTIITYYKHETDATADYKGYAHLISFKNLSIMNVSLAHTSHLPPPITAADDEELEEIELDSEPIPALGCSYRPLTYMY